MQYRISSLKVEMCFYLLLCAIVRIDSLIICVCRQATSTPVSVTLEDCTFLGLLITLSELKLDLYRVQRYQITNLGRLYPIQRNVIDNIYSLANCY